MKHQVFFLLAFVLLLSLACSLGAPAPTPVPPTATPIIIEVTPTRSAFAPEEANDGTHRYWMSPNENGCPASDDLKVAQIREKEMVFAADYSSVDYGGRTYPRVGDHRYQSINQSDKPLMLIFSEHGYVLFVYETGANPSTDQACLTFSFTLAD